MATSILLKPRNFDPTNVSFSAPRQIGTSGAKMLYLNYSNESLSIQLPNLSVGWDVKFYPDKPGSGKYQVSLKFNDLGDKKQKEMHDFLETLDKLLIKAGHENRAAWLKLPKASEEVIETCYTPLIKRSRDKETGEVNGKYPDEFRVKMVKRDGEYQFQMVDENKSEIDMTAEDFNMEEVVKKGTKFRGVIRCNGVWIGNGKFGCTWKAEQIMVENQAAMKSYAFEDTDDEEDDKENDESDSDSDSDDSESE